MNLADLRAELADRAAESRPRPSLLPGVQQKVRTTRRNRRIAGSAVVLLALVAVAVGVVPGLTRDGTPDPSKSPSPPPDYVANGVTFPGNFDGALLKKAFVGKPGQTQATFKWTPPSNALTVGDACFAEKADDVVLQVSIDGVPVHSDTCIRSKDLGGIAGHSYSGLSPSDGLWTVASPGRPATVTLRLETSEGRAVTDPTAVIGVGLYTSAPRKEQYPNVMPTRVPSPNPDDYVVDGFRYRSRIGGRTLVKAMIGSPGENTLTFEITPSSNHLRVEPFCLGVGSQSVKVSINGAESSAFHECHLEQPERRGYAHSAGTIGEGWPGVKVGQPNTVTVRLVDDRGKNATGRARIGVGVYEDGDKQRVVVGDTVVEIEKLVEYQGYDYRLADLRTAKAVARKWLSIPTPAGTPFVVAHGTVGTGLGLDGETQLAGLKHIPTQNGGVDGFSLQGQWPHPAGEASTRLVQGEPTRGAQYIAVYLPVR